MNAEASRRRIVEALPTPLAVAGFQLLYRQMSPHQHLQNAFAAFELALAYAECVLRAQAGEKFGPHGDEKSSMGQRLQVVRSLTREICGQRITPAIRLWVDDAGRRRVEAIVALRNQVAHGFSPPASGSDASSVDALTALWDAFECVSDATLVLISPANPRCVALRGPAGLFSPIAHVLRHVADRARARDSIINLRPPDTLNLGERAELVLETRSGDLLLLSPFLEPELASNSQHRVLFLRPGKAGLGYWDPLSSAEADPWNRRDWTPVHPALTPDLAPRWRPMFPQSDPADIRRKLESLCPPSKGPRGMALCYGPLLFINRQLFPIPMVHHGNIAAVDDDGVLLHMGANANPHAKLAPVQLPVIPPAMESQGPYFSQGLHLRVPFSAIVDAWKDERPDALVNLWLRHAVVMANGWTLLPLIWPPDTAPRPATR